MDRALLAISDVRSGLDEETQYGLKTASPAPRGRAEGLGHRGTVLLEEVTDVLTAHQQWPLVGIAQEELKLI